MSTTSCGSLAREAAEEARPRCPDCVAAGRSAACVAVGQIRRCRRRSGRAARTGSRRTPTGPESPAARTGIRAPPEMPNSCPRRRSSTAVERLLGAAPLLVGLEPREHQPWFGAAPLKLKPATENTPSTSGCAMQDLLGLLRDVRRVLERRARGRLDDRR